MKLEQMEERLRALEETVKRIEVGLASVTTYRDNVEAFCDKRLRDMDTERAALAARMPNYRFIDAATTTDLHAVSEPPSHGLPGGSP